MNRLLLSIDTSKYTKEDFIFSDAYMFKNLLLGLLLCLGLATPSSNLFAHPHNWISVSTHFVLNKQNQLIKIKKSWEFDSVYSMLTLAHVKNTHESEQIGLVLMAEQMSENLSGYDYFSNLIIDGNRIDIPIAEHANLTVESHPPISVMTLDLELKFQQPLDIVGKKVTWSVFDPTYYIAMNHKSVGDISITNTGNAECGKELFIPTALAETIAYADSLDKSQRNTDGLGNKFAERVYVTCL